MTRNNSDLVILEAKAISKRFPGVLALDNAYFRVYTGKVNAIVGENGAGKSTLINILSGVYTEYEGDLLLDGKKVKFRNPNDASHAGIAVIHQELQLVPHLTVAENMFMGREPLTRVGLVDHRKMRADAIAVLRRLECNIEVTQPVSSLRVGQQQIVEIAKALALDLRILIMDEPTSALSENETRVLFQLIRSLTSQGVAVVYITHKMDELTRLADYVTVLRDGSYISESAVQNVTVDEVIRLMVGREPKDFFVKEEHRRGEVKLEVKDFCLRTPELDGRFVLKDITFSVRSHEVLGLFGLMGAGRTELLESLFGLHALQASGSMWIEGEKVNVKSPSDAMRAGMALIPEDRKRDGLVLEMDIAENVSLASLGRLLRGEVLSKAREQKQADRYREKMNIKSHSSRQPVKNLSGGNQQKVVISKWLVTDPKTLFLDEPTRGIDVHAKNEIYKLINDLASQGMAIVLVSSELPEIMSISDRIVTMCEGRITGEFDRQEFSEEKILKAALPGNPEWRRGGVRGQ